MLQFVDMGFNNGSVEKNILKEYFISSLGETKLMITSDSTIIIGGRAHVTLQACKDRGQLCEAASNLSPLWEFLGSDA